MDLGLVGANVVAVAPGGAGVGVLQGLVKGARGFVEGMDRRIKTLSENFNRFISK